MYVECEHRHLFAFAEAAMEGQHLAWHRQIANDLPRVLLTVPDGVVYDADSNYFEARAPDGTLLWSSKLRETWPRKNRLGLHGIFDATTHLPYIHILNGFGLYTLDSLTGREVRYHPMRRRWSHVLADRTNTYLASDEDGRIEAIPVREQNSMPEWKWIYRCGAPLQVAPAMGPHSIVCFSKDGCLHIVSPETGEQLGYLRFPSRVLEPPLVEENTIYVPTREHGLCAIDTLSAEKPSGRMTPRDIRLQDRRWTFRLPGATLGNIAKYGEMLFVGASTGLVYGLDSASGVLLWQNDLGIPSQAGLCVTARSLVAASRGRVVCFATRSGNDKTGYASPRKRDKQATPGPPHPHSSVGNSIFPRSGTQIPIDLQLPEPELPTAVSYLPLPGSAPASFAVGVQYVYLSTESGVFLAIDRTSHAVGWTIDLGAPCRSIQVLDQMLVAVSTQMVYVLDATTGRRRAHWIDPDSPNVHVAPGERLIEFYEDRVRMAELKSDVTACLWEAKVCRRRGGQVGSAKDLLLVEVEGGVQALRQDDGQQAWRALTAGHLTSPITAGEARVFFGCSDLRLYAIHAMSGQLDWTYRTRDEIRQAATSSDGVVFIAGNDHFLTALDLDDGTVAWRFRLDSSPRGGPLLSSRAVHVLTETGHLYAVNKSGGRLLWKHDLGGAMLALPPLLAEDTLFAVTVDGRLVKIAMK